MDPDRLLDDVGLRILRELQENPRIAYTELGRRVGLTQPAVAERVHRMEEAGIIVGYRVELNMEKLGYPITAFIRVATTDVRSGHIDTLAESLSEVLECHRILGVDSYMMKVAVTSMQHLEALINRLLAYGHPTTSIILTSPVTHRLVMPVAATQPAPGAPAREGSRAQQ